MFLKKLWFRKVIWMKGGVSRFSVDNFWFHISEEFREHPFIVSKKLGYPKSLCIKGGTTFFRRKKLVSECKKCSWASLQCFTKIGVWKKFYASEREGGITFLPRKLLSHSSEKCRCGTVRCFRKFRVSQKFMHKKWISLNSDEKFLSHIAEKFREGTLQFLKKFWCRKVLVMKRGVSRFSLEKFWSDSAESFVKEPITVS